VAEQAEVGHCFLSNFRNMPLPQQADEMHGGEAPEGQAEQVEPQPESQTEQLQEQEVITEVPEQSTAEAAAAAITATSEVPAEASQPTSAASAQPADTESSEPPEPSEPPAAKAAEPVATDMEPSEPPAAEAAEPVATDTEPSEPPAAKAAEPVATDMEPSEPTAAKVAEPVATGAQDLDLVPEESRPMPVQEPPKAFPVLAPPMPAPKGIGFGLLPPPPPPSSSVVGGSNLRASKEQAVIVVDPFDITAADRLPGPVAREESRAAEDEESDDACLLGADVIEGKDQPRRIADDGIDSASDQEEAGARPSSRSAQVENSDPTAAPAEAGDSGFADSSAFPKLAPPRPLRPGSVEAEEAFDITRQASDSVVPFSDSVPAVEKPPPPTHAFGHQPSPGVAAEATGSPQSERLALPIGAESFMVKVPEPYPGLQYRKSKDLQERLPRYAKHNSVVHGFVEDGWLRVGDGHFLPMEVKHTRVLDPVPPESADVLPPLSLPHSPGQLAGHTAGGATGRSVSSTAIRPAADDDGASGEEAVPDEGPRDVPRPSYHRMLQPMGPSGLESTSLKPSGSAAGLPGRSVSLAGLPSPQGDLGPSMQPLTEAQPRAAPSRQASSGSPWPTPAPREAGSTRHRSTEAVPVHTEEARPKEPCKAARCVSADAHEFAAFDLLQRVVDPFGDAEFDERPLRARGKTMGSFERRQQVQAPKRHHTHSSQGLPSSTPSGASPDSSSRARHDNASPPKLGYANGGTEPKLQSSASAGRLLQL